MISQKSINHFIARFWKFNFVFINSRFISTKFSHYSNTKMNSPIEYSAAKAGIINMTKYLAKFCKEKLE